MYDLEFVIPADTDIPHIRQRLIDFKKFGIFNIEDAKIRLVFATSEGNDADWLTVGWHENITAELCPTPFKHVSQRTYHYYDTFLNPTTAKWYVRIDEDSMTDIKRTIENLEQFFDPDREYHIGGRHSDDVAHTDAKIAEHLGFSFAFKDKNHHEHEISITSHTAMKRIYDNAKAKKWFSFRKLFPEGHGDQGLALVARMNKIYFTPVNWLCHGPELENLSRFGGHLAHIHWTGRDQHPQIYNWLDLVKPFETIYDGEYLVQRKKREKNESVWLKLKNQSIYHSHTDNRVGIYGITEEGKLAIFFSDWRDYPELIVCEKESDKLVFDKHAFCMTKI